MPINKTVEAETEPEAEEIILEQQPFENFKYPLNINMSELVKAYKENKGNVKQKPINEYHYKFLSEIPEKCKVTQPIPLLFIVKSATQNFRRRQVVRETWGNETLIKHIILKTVFNLGNPHNSTIQGMIDIEKTKHNDIIQIDYKDSYYNNTLKTVGAIRWISNHCHNAQFAMLADDDFYIATELIVDYLKSLKGNETLFMGKVWEDIPQRGVTQKWYMSLQDYPFDKYPPFISAGATIMSMKVVTDFDVAIRFTKKFKFDDVFLAIVAYKLGIKPEHSKYIAISKPVKPEQKSFGKLWASHHYENETLLRKAWKVHKIRVAKQRHNKIRIR